MCDKNKLNSVKNILVLLAPGFEEGSAIYCVDQLRERGLPVSLVSLSNELVHSNHGVFIKPDLTLDEASEMEDKLGLVIIPGGSSSTTSLMTDPRIHRLLNNLKRQSGFMAAMETAVPILHQFKLPDSFSPRFICKEAQLDLNEFTNQLIQAVVQ